MCAVPLDIALADAHYETREHDVRLLDVSSHVISGEASLTASNIVPTLLVLFRAWGRQERARPSPRAPDHTDTHT